MKRFLACVFAFGFISGLIHAKDKFPKETTHLGVKPPLELLLSNSNLGTEFYVAIPPNDVINSGLREIGIEIVICPIADGYVEMSIKDFQKTIRKKVEAFKPVSFSTMESELAFTWELRESDKITGEAIKIKSDVPISVYVANVKRWSAEGYLALPVEAWGSKYYHCSYYDFHEGSSDRAGGFIVVAAENDTRVTITLDGVGQGVAEPEGNRSLGETYTIKLNQGDCYMLHGDGESRGQFDMSGSKFSSTKPIGVISFHMRTMIPSICPEDRDNLSEMLAPVSAWGRTFATVQFNRIPEGSREGDGDFFRAVTDQAQNKIECEYFDKVTNQKMGNSGGQMSQPGDFWETDIKAINNSNKLTSIRGVSYWESPKPIEFFQYAFSNRWDGDGRWSPLQILISPVENYVSDAVFQTPYETGFAENELTLIAIGDPDDPEKKLLHSIKLDGESIFHLIQANRISQTNLYWVQIDIEPGIHIVESDTKFTGFVNGFSSYNSYGWPIGVGTNKIDEHDELPPEIIVSEECGTFECRATEDRNGSPVPEQIDQGVRNVILLESNNFALALDDSATFKPQYKMSNVGFTLTPIDKQEIASAKVAVIDKAGNIAYENFEFEPESVSVMSEEIDFGKLRIGKSSSILAELIRNDGDEPINVMSISTENGDPVFSYGEFAFPQTLENGDIFSAEITYSPTAENCDYPDYETIIVSTECFEYSIPATGCGIAPHIMAAECSIDTTLIGEKKCCGDESPGIEISNPGEDTLRVTGLSAVSAPFNLSEPTDPAVPFKIPPGGSVELKSLCFVPAEEGDFTTEIIVSSDAFPGENDSLITINAIAKKPEDPGHVFDLNKSGFLNVVPNPSGDEEITLQFGEVETPAIVEIRNLLGAVVLRKELTRSGSSFGSTVLDVSNLAAGTYIVAFKSGNKCGAVKFIKLN